MMKRTPNVFLPAALFVLIGAAAATQENSSDVWKPFQFFIGNWEGSGEGQSGVSTGKQEFRFVLGGRFLQVGNEAVFKPQERNPEGERHEDWGFFSYDRLRKAYVLRQFHVEGFVNQYVCTGPSADGKTFVFLSEAIENLPPGFTARLTYRILDDDRFEQTFDLAAPGREMECYSKGIMTRAGSGRPAVEEKKRPVQVSPPCDVRVSLDVTSPFVPDGRTSLAHLSLEVVFPAVTFEFDPSEDPLLGRCQVNSAKGQGTIRRLVLNDVQRGDERLSPRFLSARPQQFLAALGIESEPMAEEETAAESGTAPHKVRLAFWTEFGPSPVKWGSKFGTASLSDFRIVFEVPFRDLLAGKGVSIEIPYQGHYPEDGGTWRVEIRPGAQKE